MLHRRRKLISKLVSALQVHLGTKDRIELMPVEIPEDFYNLDLSRPNADTRRFSAAAYGPSTLGLSIPEVLTLDQVAPLPADLRRFRERLDRDDVYANETGRGASRCEHPKYMITGWPKTSVFEPLPDAGFDPLRIRGWTNANGGGRGMTVVNRSIYKI